MTLKEKYDWMKLFAWEFGMFSVLMFVFGLKGDVGTVVTGGITVAVCIAVLTLILLFRITYLKGKKSR